MNQEAVKPFSSWKGLLGWLPGLIFSLLAIYVLSRVVTWQQVVSALRSVNPWLFVPILATSLMGLLIRATAWRIILQKKVSLLQAFFALNEGYLLNNIFPLRLGELGRALLLGRSSGLGMLTVLSSIVVERAYDLAISAGLLLATLPLALGMDWARPLAWLILALVIAGLVGLAVAARYRVALVAYAAQRGWDRSRLGGWLLPKLEALLGGFGALTDLRLFALSFSILLASWVIGMFGDWLLLSAFVPHPPFWWLGFFIGVAALGGALPSSSGAVGVLEAAIVTALVILKVDQSTALAFGITRHLFQFCLTCILGMVGLSREGASLTGIYRELRMRRNPTD